MTKSFEDSFRFDILVQFYREMTTFIKDLDFLLARSRAIHASRSPVFVGELGQHDPHLQADPEAKWTHAAIDALDEEGVALIALWVWHFPWQDKDHNIPSGASHPLLMRRVAEFNREHARPILERD